MWEDAPEADAEAILSGSCVPGAGEWMEIPGVDKEWMEERRLTNVVC